MTAPQLTANRANAQLSTGPQTPEGKQNSSRNSFRHGLCGKIHAASPEDQEAFQLHCGLILEALAPVGTLEQELAQAIAEDQWRLKRARALENAIFAQGFDSQLHEDGNAGDEVDVALAAGQTWIEQARNLQLLTLYEQRINRVLVRNTADLEAKQAIRKAAHAQAVKEAMVFTEFAQFKGEVYDPLPDFPDPEDHGGFVYSSAEIVRLIHRSNRFGEAVSWRATRGAEPHMQPATRKRAA